MIPRVFFLESRCSECNKLQQTKLIWSTEDHQPRCKVVHSHGICNKCVIKYYGVDILKIVQREAKKERKNNRRK